jgi:hypothetical protein
MANSTSPSSPTGNSVPQPPSPTTTHPTLTYHTSLLPRSIPTPGLLDSAVSGAHYSGVESVNERRRSSLRHSQSLNCGGANHHGATRRHSALPAIPNPAHLAILDDIKDVRARICLLSRCKGNVLTPFVFIPLYSGFRCMKVWRRRKCYRNDGERMRNTRYAILSNFFLHRPLPYPPGSSGGTGFAKSRIECRMPLRGVRACTRLRHR